MCMTLGDSDLLTIAIKLTMFVSLIILRMHSLYKSSKVKLKIGMAKDVHETCILSKYNDHLFISSICGSILII